MAILERTLTGDFTTILTELDAVVKQSVSATLEGSSDFNFSTGRCAVRVYERYSAIGNGRVTMSLTLLEADGRSGFPPSHPAAARLCFSRSTP